MGGDGGLEEIREKSSKELTCFEVVVVGARRDIGLGMKRKQTRNRSTPTEVALVLRTTWRRT